MKIFAVGMNYAQHNKELDGTLYKPETPVIFTKADSALLKDRKPFFIPDHLGQIDYEAELVVRICKLGKTVPERFAHRYYDAVTVGIDFTARELQKKLREAGQPWDLCKGFDGAAALGEWVSKEKFRDVQAMHFHLDINGHPWAWDPYTLTTTWRDGLKTARCWSLIVNKQTRRKNDSDTIVPNHSAPHAVAHVLCEPCAAVF